MEREGEGQRSETELKARGGGEERMVNVERDRRMDG